MRLICPNCDAEYEVDASAIPDSGRDVQCSNCGHAWFQLPPDHAAADEAEAALFDPPAALAVAPPVTPPAAEVPQPVAAAEPETPAPEVPRRSLDESVLAVLREEAERETSARRAETPVPLETQPEFPLEPARSVAPEQGPPAEPLSPAAARIARLKGIEPAPAKPATRKELLPDIEEINSTLRTGTDRQPAETPAALPQPRERAGFRSGFSLMLLLAVVLTVLYVMAPRLAAQIPALDGPLAAYVGTVDQARVALDTAMKAAVGMLRGAQDG